MMERALFRSLITIVMGNVQCSLIATAYVVETLEWTLAGCVMGGILRAGAALILVHATSARQQLWTMEHATTQRTRLIVKELAWFTPIAMACVAVVPNTIGATFATATVRCVTWRQLNCCAFNRMPPPDTPTWFHCVSVFPIVLHRGLHASRFVSGDNTRVQA